MSDSFARRRARVLEALGPDAALVAAAAPQLVVGPDTDVRYVAAADLFYLTGVTAPEAVLVMSPSADRQSTLFVRPRDPERELWTGMREDVEAARLRYGVDATYPVTELAARLPGLLEGAARIYTSGEDARTDVHEALRDVLTAARRSRPRTGRGPHTVTDASVLLAPMRVRKDAQEIAAIRAAAAITVAAFEDAARALRGAAHEYVVEAAVEHGFRSRGADGPAFPTIAAAGANAAVLHYTTNNTALRRGELLLLDAGARLHMYCADITRTFPIGGTFSPEQRAVYDIVLAAHDAVIDACVVGHTAGDLDDVAIRNLAQGMLDLRILQGPLDAVIEQRTWRRFFPHRVSHWLGLDVHDAGDYVTNGRPTPLETGMVLTVEPGLYIPHDSDAPEALRGIGIRLEDDVLITDADPDVITGALPIRAEAIEEMVR